jgi:hypothetical protein
MPEHVIDRVKRVLRSQAFNVVEKLGRRVGYPGAPLHYEKLASYFHLKELYDQIVDVPGDIAECGVAYGDSLIVLCTLSQLEGKNRVVYGFDSFEGFPEPTAEDHSPRAPKKGDFADATLERVRQAIRKADVREPVLVKGFLEHTLPQFKSSLALVHLDVDIYSSYKTGLTELFDRVMPGGIVAFDEYKHPKWPGATQAIDEFLAGRHRVQKAKSIDKYYVVKR